jgi:hypothetical protein
VVIALVSIVMTAGLSSPYYAALQGTYVGGVVGAAFGAGIGMYQYENLLVEKGNLLIKKDAIKALVETYLNQSKFLFGLKDGSRWLFSKDVSIGFINASLFAFSQAKTVVTSKNNPYVITDLAINFLINLMTQVPNISYSTYHEINEKTNRFDYLTY